LHWSYMLDSITIKNFKAIQGESVLTLKSLAQVNYLVGPNGCGKSSVLEGIYLYHCCLNEKNSKEESQVKNIQNVYNYFEGRERLSGFIHKNSKIELGEKLAEKIGLVFEKDKNKRLIKFFFNSDPESLFNSFVVYLTSEVLIPEGDEYIGGKKTRSGYRSPQGINFEKVPLIFSHLNPIEPKALKNIIEYLFSVSYKETREVDAIKSHIDDLQVRLVESAGGFVWATKFAEYISRRLVDKSDRKLIFLLEEPEIGLHPNAQKKFVGWLSDFIKKVFEELEKNGRLTIPIFDVQFFISTHSPFIVNAALELEGQKVYQLSDGTCPNPLGISKEDVSTKKVWDIYDGLGAKPSDLLFANCLIWAEGPSDAIYISFWLSKFTNGELKKGRDYEIAMYGGASANNFDVNVNGFNRKNKEERGKIFSLVKNHPKFFVVLDNDGGELRKIEVTEQKLKKGTKIPKNKVFEGVQTGDSSFEDFKFRVISSSDNYFYCDNPELDTVEKFLPKEVSFEKGKKGNKTGKLKWKNSKNSPKKKTDFAEDYIKNYKKKDFEDCLNNEGQEMIKKIHDFIVF
jgi:predicted ATP-dependent endonuclease of OLD family